MSLLARTSGAFVVLVFALGAGCGTEDHVNIFHATFQEGAAPKDFTTDIGFTDLGDGVYTISYQAVRTSDPTAPNYLQISVPDHPRANDVYSETSPSVMLLYRDPQNNWFDSRSNGSTLTLTVSAWAGYGGYGNGTFSAVLRDDAGHTATLTGGTWEGFVHTRPSN